MTTYEEGPDFDFDDIYGRDPRNPENGGDGGPPPPDPDDPGPQPGDFGPDPAPDDDDPYAEEPPPKIEWTVAADLEGLPVPPREWIVDEWMPVRTVTSLNGDGGTGKSLVAMQLATSLATGTPFFGLRVQQCTVLGIFCEDDGDELHRRLWSICDQHEIKMGDLGEFVWTARAGEQNNLVHESPITKGHLDWSGLFYAIEDRAKEIGARVIILDNIAQMYGANENDRVLVTSFVNRLHKLAVAINGAVLLLGHPGKGGVAKEFSGSTAWDAAVRSRWLLRRPEAEEDEEEGAGDFIRELCKMKANYSSIGDMITLEWDRGAFHQLGSTAPNFKSMDQKCAESAREAQINAMILQALDTLRGQNRTVVLTKTQPHAAVKVLPTLDPFKKAGVKRKEIEAALQRLFDAGLIRNGMCVYQKSNRHWAEGIGRTTWEQPSRGGASSRPEMAPDDIAGDAQNDDDNHDDGEEGKPE